jgi:hypothetical protein
VKHASASALRSLEEFLANLRRLPGLIERKPGIFSAKSQAYLYFHEDAAGLFADVKLAGHEFERFRVSTGREQAAILQIVVLNRTAPNSENL